MPVILPLVSDDLSVSERVHVNVETRYQAPLKRRRFELVKGETASNPKTR
jgi:hypothetical protein